MRTALYALFALAIGFVMVAGLHAQDKKEVTLKGTIMCAKCALKEAKKCQTVIRVKEEGKEVTYYFDDKGNKEEYHEEASPIPVQDRAPGSHGTGRDAPVIRREVLEDAAKARRGDSAD